MGEYKCFQYENDGTHRPNDWWNYICENAAYTPQSGEMFHNTHKQGIIPSGDEVIKELAHHRHTTLSQWNNYLETPDYEKEPDENVTWTLTGKILCLGKYNENNGFLLNGSQYIAPNSELLVKTAFCEFNITVIDIEKSME